LKIFPEILVESGGRILETRLAQDVGNGPATAMRRTDHSNGSVIFLLNDYFAALLNLREHGA
jgi:hypothetical protein